jgi:hypothetical protein
LSTADIPREEVIKAGMTPVLVSPYSGSWMSRLDPARAKNELNFRHCPLDQYVAIIAQTFLAHPPAEPPEGYRTRELELGLIRKRSS